ncbi:MAG: 5-dehydro-4-deoxy-D-glucuronate isomerase, partial [Schleiferilactobacillus harbinensis]|nr:5-dehydro-4-deoxy-D-glucuronate isomerase [Schleiferilactobacillus harbinensis]
MAFSMVTQYAHSPEDIQHYDTDKLREQFLMPKLFEPGN